MADAPDMPPRLIAAADQLQAQIAEDMREFGRNLTSFDEQLERAKAVFDAYDDLPLEACCAAITGALAEVLEAGRIVIHDSRIETEGRHGRG